MSDETTAEDVTAEDATAEDVTEQDAGEQVAVRDGAINDVDVEIYAVLGQSTMLVSQLLKIGRGAIIELDQRTSDPVEIQVNQKPIAYGEIVTLDDKLGITITEVIKKQIL